MAAVNNLSVDATVREQSGVAKCNNYLFPHTKGSPMHVAGWHAVHRMCIAAKLKESSTYHMATRIRHRVSTIFASKDVSEREIGSSFIRIWATVKK